MTITPKTTFEEVIEIKIEKHNRRIIDLQKKIDALKDLVYIEEKAIENLINIVNKKEYYYE
jgi:hypothetical protein